MKRTTVLRVLGLAAIALFLTCVFTPLPNVLGRWAGTPPQLGSAQAIVVLGGGLQADGELNDISIRRVLHGIVLYRRGLASLLVLLGEPRGNSRAEAVVRAELAGTLGVPPDAILTETRAFTTREEAGYVEELLRSKGVGKILLVTDSYHMGRAKGVFQKAGFEVLAAPADDFSALSDFPKDRLAVMQCILQECAARFYYRIAGYL